MILLTKEKQRGLLITLAIVIVVVLVGVKIILQPQQTQVAKLKTEIKKETERNSLIKQIITVENSIKGYKDKLPSLGESSWLEEKLRQLSAGLDIEVIRIKAKDDIEEMPGLSCLTVEAKLKADYHKIGKLVSQLEKSPEFIEVKKVKISSLSSQAWDKLAQVEKELAVLTNARRRGRGPIQQEAAADTINQPADLEAVINQSKEVEAILEVSTYYVR